MTTHKWSLKNQGKNKLTKRQLNETFKHHHKPIHLHLFHSSPNNKMIYSFPHWGLCQVTNKGDQGATSNNEFFCNQITHLYLWCDFRLTIYIQGIEINKIQSVTLPKYNHLHILKNNVWQTYTFLKIQRKFTWDLSISLYIKCISQNI